MLFNFIYFLDIIGSVKTWDERFINAWGKMIEKLEGWFSTLVVNLPNIVLAILVFVLVIMLSRLIRKWALRLLGRTKLRSAMQNLVAQIISVFVVLLGLLFVLGILNLDKTLNALLTGAGVAGLAVGLALQGALANTFAGIVISYIKLLKFGDWVKSNGYEGEVVDIDLSSVTIKQADNNLVYLPNKLVIENPIINYSTTAQSRVMLSCGVAYGSDLEFVRDLTVKTITQTFDAVTKQEEVIFLFTEFGDSAINFEVRFWIDSTSGLEIARAKSQAIIEIKKAFDANGITIPFPIRTLDFPKGYKA